LAGGWGSKCVKNSSKVMQVMHFELDFNPQDPFLFYKWRLSKK
jgi:hypothetical protein